MTFIAMGWKNKCYEKKKTCETEREKLTLDLRMTYGPKMSQSHFHYRVCPLSMEPAGFSNG